MPCAALPLPLRLGLTGGIGSGKSTVAALLAEGGAAAIVDADAISRAATAAGGAAIPAISAAFGAHMVDATGALDRAAMRALVSSNHGVRRRLEAIVHPIVLQESRRQAQAAQQRGARLVVFDVPLLAESGARWRAQLDGVLVVDCEPEEQIARVAARSGWPRAHIEGIMAVQAVRVQRLAAADIVVCNGRGVSLPALRARVQALRRRLMGL